MDNSVYITDYIEKPDIEKGILGNALSASLQDSVRVLLVWHEHITKEYMERLPNLEAVVRYGVGFDAIDLKAAAERGIRVCNTPDYGVDEVSDTALAFAMGYCRRIWSYNLLAKQLPEDWQENTITSIRRTSQTVVGVVGAGRIGGSLARKAKAVGFDVVIYDPYQPSGIEKLLNVRRAETLEDLLAESDIVSVHTPLNEETKGMINSSFLSGMKPGAALINTARGGILESVDTLIPFLESEQLAFAGLDVLPQEPPVDEGLITAWRQMSSSLEGRLVINPHTAYYSIEAYVEMRTSAAQNAMRILKGQTPRNIIV